MARIKRGRPSPGLVVGVLALVVALAGTAVAGSGPGATDAAQHKLTSAQKKQVNKIAKKKGKKEAKKLDKKFLPIEAKNLGSITEANVHYISRRDFRRDFHHVHIHNGDEGATERCHVALVQEPLTDDAAYRGFYDGIIQTPLSHLQRGRRALDIIKFLEMYDQRMAMAALADVILLGHEKVGSFALADAKTNLTGMFGGALTDIITGQFNRRAIPQLMRVNGMDLTKSPLLVPGDMESLDLQDIAAYVQALSGAGMPLFPDDALEAHLRSLAGLPGESQELE